jgi:SAM-dependent methyltransferase
LGGREKISLKAGLQRYLFFMALDFSGNVARFSWAAEVYARYRPAPPEALAGLLVSLAQVDRPALVADLGCGTGLSTRYWVNRADQVIGIDPTEAMRALAEAADNVRYRQAFSHDTGLPDGCADIVTCSQALHWMDPLPTFHEVRRILRPGGVFAAYDYDWPPMTGVWEADAAYDACLQHGKALEKARGVSDTVRHWDKTGHLQRMRESGVFRHVREVLLHHQEEGNADRFVGLLLSQGWAATLLASGLTESDLGVDVLRAKAGRLLGPKPRLWHWSSRVRVGIV